MKYIFLPEDLDGEQGVGRQVLREDLVALNKVLSGLLKLGPSSNTLRQPGRQICGKRKNTRFHSCQKTDTSNKYRKQ